MTTTPTGKENLARKFPLNLWNWRNMRKNSCKRYVFASTRNFITQQFWAEKANTSYKISRACIKYHANSKFPERDKNIPSRIKDLCKSTKWKSSLSQYRLVENLSPTKDAFQGWPKKQLKELWYDTSKVTLYLIDLPVYMDIFPRYYEQGRHKFLDEFIRLPYNNWLDD